jgi:hypothetical protein
MGNEQGIIYNKDAPVIDGRTLQHGTTFADLNVPSSACYLSEIMRTVTEAKQALSLGPTAASTSPEWPWGQVISHNIRHACITHPPQGGPTHPLLQRGGWRAGGSAS